MVKLMRKTFIILFIFVLVVISPVSYFYNSQYTYVYASSASEPVNRDELVESFRAYCKSRDLTIDGSASGAITSFTTRTFNILCNTVGIDITALQSEINKVVDPTSNSLKYFVYSASGIGVFNRLFAQFLQDNDIKVGDEDINKRVYDGYYYGGQLFYVFNSGSNNTSVFSPDMSDGLIAIGSDLTPKGSYIYNNYPISSNNGAVGYTQSITCPDDQVYVVNAYKSKPNSYIFLYSQQNNPRASIYEKNYNNGDVVGDGAMCFMHDNRTGNDYLGSYMLFTSAAPSYPNKYQFTRMIQIGSNGTEPASVDVVSPVVKPDLPEDPTNISPDGNATPSDQDPTEPIPDPSGGTPPNWDIDADVVPDGNGGFNIPFSLPDLNIDWKIEGLTKKFPFCIPFDVVSFCQVLRAEPVAPRISGNVPIGTLTTWSFDYDLSDYNDWASILRTVELFGFVIGLIFITVKLVKG